MHLIRRSNRSNRIVPNEFWSFSSLLLGSWAEERSEERSEEADDSVVGCKLESDKPYESVQTVKIFKLFNLLNINSNQTANKTECIFDCLLMSRIMSCDHKHSLRFRSGELIWLHSYCIMHDNRISIE